MKTFIFPFVACAATLAALPLPAQTDTPFRFEEVTASAGLAPLLANWELGHAAAWGDVNGDGRPDLYIGSFADRPLNFASNAPVPNILWLNTTSGFVRSAQPALELPGAGARVSHAVFADLDNDGDLDLIQGQHVYPKETWSASENGGKEVGERPSVIYENDGAGRFKPVPAFGPWPPLIGARNIAPLDVDRDGRLDLLIADGSYGRGAANKLLLLRNLGGFRFEDASLAWGLPTNRTQGLGLALGDLNEDGRPDVFVSGGNRLLLSQPDGPYRDGGFTPFPRLSYDQRDSGGMYCGAAFGDLNGDGRLDLVITLHALPARLYVLLDESPDPAAPRFVDRSAELGLDRLFPTRGINKAKMKAAHVELRDMDNDGRLDIALAAAALDPAGKPQPVVLRNLGVAGTNGLPRFSEMPWDRLAGYYAPGAIGDYDADGRLDIFLPSWFPSNQVPSYLFRNVTPGGRYLDVRVRDGAGKRNPMGIGAVVRAYRAGHAGDPKHLIQRGDLYVGFGYASGQEPVVHLGLGSETACDLTVAWEGVTNTFPAVKANQSFTAVFGR